MTEFKFIDNTGAALALLMTAAQDYCLIGPFFESRNMGDLGYFFYYRIFTNIRQISIKKEVRLVGMIPDKRNRMEKLELTDPQQLFSYIR